MKLSWINESVTNGEHNNLMHNALYAAEVIARSVKRGNALEAMKQAHDAGYITDEYHKKALKEIMANEGFEFEFTE